MEFRAFELKSDINQLEYVTFRSLIQKHKPDEWAELLDVPIELFYYVMVIAAVQAGFVADVVEENKYGEEETWSWKESGLEYINNMKAGEWPVKAWGSVVFDRWAEIRNLDPN